MKTKPIVTRQSLLTMLQADKERQIQVVGRALVALFRRQTEDERTANATKHDNSVGFSAPDAKSGTLSAKAFMKHGTLEDWQLAKWMRLENGRPRIVKYADQLNQIALEKRAK